MSGPTAVHWIVVVEVTVVVETEECIADEDTITVPEHFHSNGTTCTAKEENLATAL